ncbi:TMhelix containing protein [Vibrio phage 1.174.O._10N.261.55.A8]|nr:TMhelix containing protein [Vibrio phage 1.174.O._10N.261.55.A8]
MIHYWLVFGHCQLNIFIFIHCNVVLVYKHKPKQGLKMAIEKKQEKRVMIGVKESTKDRFEYLVKKINHDNLIANGDKARKITHDDVLNELVTAYMKVGV